MTNWVKAALTKDVSDDSIQQLNINGCKVALYRCGEEYFATSDVCTHAYALLSDGWLVDLTSRNGPGNLSCSCRR